MRQRIVNGSNYGKLMLLIGCLVGVPLLVLPFYPSDAKYIPAFLVPMAFSLAAGYLICAATGRKQASAKDRQSPLLRGSLPVLFVWCYGFLMGAMPFVISGRLGFVRALFESVSGWTTTGLSLIDVRSSPRIFLFHQSFMQFCGGLGFVMMMAIVIQGKQSMELFNAEGHVDRFLPSLRQTSRTVFLMYGKLLAAGALLYTLFGMKLFDAVCHAMSAISTAGFTTQTGSIGAYDDPALEIITAVLMLAGALNFAALLLLAKGKLRSFLRVTEIRFMIVLLAVCVPLSAWSLASEMNMSLGESFRHALFGVISIFTTTGYSTMNYSAWPPFSLGLIFVLMFVGGCAGSTAGGIKSSRAYLLLRIMRENIRKRISPHNKTTLPTFHTARGKEPIDASLVADTFGFIACYVCVFVLGALLLTVTAGCSLPDAMFEFASMLGTVGVSNGLTNAGANTATLIVEMAGMILGRLEIFVVFFGLASGVQLMRHRLQKNRG